MEFVKLMKEYNRMCEYHSDNRHNCEDCPLCEENFDIKNYSGRCNDLFYTNPELVEKIIMQWSREHPLPVYPTIREILNKISILMHIDPKTEITSVLDYRLNKETADYFGIKPINENTLKSKI